ncbi:hypothetical protein RN607_00700 [Demequina capsici]|uniref:Uncharacterized protein n=1 Tax=Demequina capsici TaxID=3075620 RepID=A0AA96J9R3_9MICO|nr:hypothetical protein [Demequina sp. PMTSA13]WNM27552.1 hypothetical protein RN607_00700 [Demequina sp. PMTSA13]
MASAGLTWPNAEKAVVAWLKNRTTKYVATETDDTLGDHLPAYRVARAGGTTRPDGTGLTKVIQIEIETIAGDRASLWAAVAEIESAMYALSGNGLEGWFIDEVEETFAAAVVSSDSDGDRRASATYGLAVRPHTTTN